MCIIIVRPPGGHLKRKELKEAFRINDDGAGFMFDAPGSDGTNEVRVLKGWFGFRKFYKTFRDYEELYPDSTFVLHMRIGTSGLKDAANCHPFSVCKDVGFAHNGVMHLLGDKVRSDTREFVEDVLMKLPHGWWDNEKVIAAITECADKSSSKYVMLVSDGSYYIFNEIMGHWNEGCWYSNSSYKIPTYLLNSKPRSVLFERTYNRLDCRDDDPEDDYDLSNYERAMGKMICICCHKEVLAEEIGYKRGWIRLCYTCLEEQLGKMLIRCDTCQHKQILTKAMLGSDSNECPFCHSEITTDEISWQIMGTHSWEDSLWPEKQ